MGRWEPDASGRLRAAAMELYLDQGYEQTTVADIAERAGVTPRTFFRYFTDKREVLFAGSDALTEHVIAVLREVPAGTSPMQCVATAIAACGDLLTDQRFSQKRHAIISANAELRERELIKLARLAAALSAELRRRGVKKDEALLAAETGVTVFRVAFERWTATTKKRSFTEVVEESFAQLGTLVAG